MKPNIKIELPVLSCEERNRSFELLTLKRGEQRIDSLAEFIVAALKNCTVSPTKDELQKLSQIRRDRFLPVLRDLIGTGAINRTGTGLKGEPFRYRLPG